MALLNTSTTITADGNTASVKHPGGDLYVGLTGTFGSGTVTLYASFDGGTTWITVGPDAAKTADALYSVTLPDCHVRLTTSGSTAPAISYFLSVRKSV